MEKRAKGIRIAETAFGTMNSGNFLTTTAAAISLYIITYYNIAMAELFKAKVRKVGSSFGVLIPMEIMTKEYIKEGEEVQLSVLKERKLDTINKFFGIAKGTKPFRRDRTDRTDRWV